MSHLSLFYSRKARYIFSIPLVYPFPCSCTIPILCLVRQLTPSGWDAIDMLELRIGVLYLYSGIFADRQTLWIIQAALWKDFVAVPDFARRSTYARVSLRARAMLKLWRWRFPRNRDVMHLHCENNHAFGDTANIRASHTSVTRAN